MEGGVLMEVFACEPLGFDAYLVRVEADIRTGIPAVEIVGLASTAVREARERARIAIRNSGFEFPSDRILVNLSPADLPKEGSAYDLPIALKILSQSGQIAEIPRPLLVLGELTLSGDVCSVRGVLPAARAAVSAGIHLCIVPAENAAEAVQVDSMQVWPIAHLGEISSIISAIEEKKTPSSISMVAGMEGPDEEGLEPDFSDFRGGQQLLRALVVAAAGRHNMFLAGPPGAGKTMAASRFPSILPDLGDREALDIASLHSLCGDRKHTRLRRRPPFRAPHHSASLEGMLGGSRPVRPGEVSLAHHGVLFLDECPEFRRDVLQSLREPAEQGYVDLVRAGRTVRFPSDFQLIMAANPCPCGNLGIPGKTCLCSPEEIRRYWKRLGGPLMDRLDMRIAVTPPSSSELLASAVAESTALRRTVKNARELQMDRNGSPNARIPPGTIPRLCRLDGAADRMFRAGIESFGLSARASHAVLKVARTIADLDGRMDIGESAVEEALSYRMLGEGDTVWPF